MKIGIPREIFNDERRVAATPPSVHKLISLGYEVAVESGAGEAANYSDAAYEKVGAEIAADPTSLWREADFILKVRAPMENGALGKHEADLMKEGAFLVSYIWPAQNPELLEKLAARKITTFAIDSLPRISRAQKMDALSAMANIAGYRAVIEAANNFGRFFTGQVTAAGKVPPAKVMVIGAGVAGLSAVGAANSLGAIVRAFDTRLEVKEQIESMGAEFLQLDFGEEEGSGTGGYAKQMSDEFIKAEMALFAEQAKEVDIIITTALIPGKPAPKLITAEMVKSMKPGSVIVDLASERGGNCELTEPGKITEQHEVTLIGYTDLPSRMAKVASDLYATNLFHLLTELTPEKDGKPQVNMDDDVIRGLTVVLDQDVTWPPPQPQTPTSPKPAPGTEEPSAEQKAAAHKESRRRSLIGKGTLLVITLAALYGIGAHAPDSFLRHFTVFVLACFIGWQVVWNVTASLHTPLMSVTNAISGIIVIGAMLHLAQAENVVVGIMAFVAVLIASINVGGGFRVTHRMLKMFRK
ncbi:Re/Si-specific NAD(P)(+) transhydrogenase subunit alpha [Marinobacter sp. 1_MG-2023]|uniref:Re/Si-specific NAD(P)(+) transhydrogenase subunit alpha n=1 Tax=Marinobacter sp. 1_MG-2023 TaxID=3062627 RepID=UPI0026E146C1|nr:Re/Si-specific NAD(P)(+) transhydrogenase subunit alpha [Marinobacter sp. 1_MG-2023]MDO6822182.1 Re/Si-specific NAD(P)(+) transhydrogenase subunit alpha [Marinobacter sp. 1_MG-2023]